MSLRYDNVVICLDFSRIVESGGNRYLWDYSKNDFHFRFGPGAAAPVPQLDGSCLFSGAQYAYYDGDLARFYAAAPAGAFTAAWVSSYSTVAGGTPRVFSCWNSTAGGTDLGIVAAMTDVAAAGRARAYQCQGAAAQPYVASAAAEPYLRVGGRSCCILTVEAAPLGMINDQRAAAAWAVGAFGAAVYDAAIVPRIGMDPAGTNPFTGRARYFLLYDGALTEDDQRQLMTHMVEGRAAFCYRRP